ncbi:MAG TPA: nucleotide exchange factor GrpE [Streptosporangiaceae bacterium]
MSDTPVSPEDTAGPAKSADTGPAGPGGEAAPAGLGDQVADPEDQIAGLRARIGELEDLRRRALADLDNVQKRCAAQITRVETETRAAVAREWLPVIDNLDRALEHSSADPAAIIEGVRAVRDQALGVLGRLGFPRREDDQGAMFDPARHDALAARDAAGAADGSVVEVVRPGYGEGAHQLRPAQVVVARSD